MMRMPVQHDFFDRVPNVTDYTLVHSALWTWAINCLQPRACAEQNGKADQRRAERSKYFPVLGGDRQPRAPPYPRLHLVDMHRADDFLRGHRRTKRGQRSEWLSRRSGRDRCPKRFFARRKIPVRRSAAASRYSHASVANLTRYSDGKNSGNGSKIMRRPPARKWKAPNMPRTCRNPP